MITRKKIPFCDCNLEATNFTILKKSSLYRLMVPFSNLGFMSFTSVGCANYWSISRLSRGPTWPLICFKVWYGQHTSSTQFSAEKNCGKVQAKLELHMSLFLAVSDDFFRSATVCCHEVLFVHEKQRVGISEFACCFFTVKWEFDKMGAFGQNPCLF